MERARQRGTEGYTAVHGSLSTSMGILLQCGHGARAPQPPARGAGSHVASTDPASRSKRRLSVVARHPHHLPMINSLFRGQAGAGQGELPAPWKWPDPSDIIIQMLCLFFHLSQYLLSNPIGNDHVGGQKRELSSVCLMISNRGSC